MSDIYGMQRANGDWFALDEHGRLRVPLFSTERDGMLARGNHRGMHLFKPVALDARTIKELVPEDGVTGTDFWLVDNPFTHLNRGRPIDRAQLSLLVQDAAAPRRE